MRVALAVASAVVTASILIARAPAAPPATQPKREFALELPRVPAPMTADQARAFIRRLHEYVRNHHLKKAENSLQRGMLYEYFNVPRAGKVDQFIEGEALDTMHDGSWYATAMVNAARATGDDAYRSF